MEKLAFADQELFLWLNGFVGQFPLFDRLITWLVSDYTVPVCMALVLVATWFAGKDAITRQRYQIGLMMALTAMALSSFAVFITNAMYFRPRPFDALDVNLLFYEPTDSSFPANDAAAMYGMAFGVWTYNRPVGTLLIGIASVYCFARVYSGVHYPLDVVGGVVIAVAITFVAIGIRKALGPIPRWVIRAGRVLNLA